MHMNHDSLTYIVILAFNIDFSLRNKNKTYK